MTKEEKNAILKTIEYIEYQIRINGCHYCDHCKYGYQKKYEKECKKQSEKCEKEINKWKDKLKFWENKLKE